MILKSILNFLSKSSVSISLYVISELTFWLSCSFYYLLDKYLPFKYLEKFKYYSPKTMLEGYNKKTLTRVIYNHLFVAPLFIPFIGFLYNSKFTDDLPTFYTIIYQYLGAIVFQDVLFHIHHVILHWPYFYGKIHKIHHEFKKEVIGISAHYVHFIEFAILYYPIVLGPILLKMHPLFFNLWIIMAIIVNVSGHSGYFSKEHFLHHKYYNYNYGSNINFDKLFGTFLKYNRLKHQ